MSRHRIVDAAADVLSRRVDRRGFLGRAAVAGTALAVNPAAYVLRPVSAYAAICTCSGQSCDCGSRCCDGYTEFCCTITGRNSCPPGTLTAGWWKVDGSNFCGGGPRYYMDCNAGCGSCGCGASGVCSGGCSGTGCGCANGNCGNRKSGCTLFRYGQCNQAVPCVGPIVCRVVSCVPPWQLDATCTTSPRTDENTRYHDAPCLHEPPQDPNRPFGNVDAAVAITGGISVQGWAIDPDTTGPVEVHVYVDGAFAGYGSANEARSDLSGLGYGPNHGFSISVAAGEGTHQVCVYAINVVSSTQNPQLGCRSVRIGGPPFGNIDAVTTGPGLATVSGWALDPDTTAPIEVHAYVDGRFAGATSANQTRTDLAGLGYGTSHGFTMSLAVGEGSHQVCIYAINVGSSPVNPSIGCRSFTVGGPPFGNVDAVNAAGGIGTISGWAIDPDTTAPVEIHVYVDGRFATYGYADQDRPDVGSTFPAYGRGHGFSLSFPLAAGAHDVCAYAINVGSGRVNPSLGCRRVTA